MSIVTELKEGVEPDNLVRPAFTKKYLDSEREDTGGEVLTIRINPIEREAINKLKKALNYSQDAKVLKIGLVVLGNVVHGTFGEHLMVKISDPDRRRSIFDDSKEKG